MNTDMLVFEKDNNRFNCRSVAVFINDDHVLLHKIGNNPYWSLPGGRVEFIESAQTTVVREVEEELKIKCEVVRPLWIMENFFNYKEKKLHEIAFYFLVTCPQELLNKGSEFVMMENGTTRLQFKWIKIADLEQEILYPSFLRTALKSLPENLEYIVHRG